jgi:phage baseplate assembly protein W
MAVFIGFGSNITGPVKLLQDMDLIKKDLLNQFATRKGERVIDSEYGFIGHDLLFELQVQGIESLLESDSRRIIKSDPRVQERSIVVTKESNGYTVTIHLYFYELDTVDTLELFFNNAMLQSQD